jgi:hypothetical protein
MQGVPAAVPMAAVVVVVVVVVVVQWAHANGLQP